MTARYLSNGWNLVTDTPAGLRSARPRNFFITRVCNELVWVDNDNALPPAPQNADLLPFRKRSAYCVERCAGHLGKILTADRKVDLDAGIELASRGTDKVQQRPGDPT
jgi:hypothetical protein